MQGPAGGEQDAPRCSLHTKPNGSFISIGNLFDPSATHCVRNGTKGAPVLLFGPVPIRPRAHGRTGMDFHFWIGMNAF